MEGARALWAHVAPHLPQPKDDDAAWITLHYARTAAPPISFHMRAYSHRWLTERGLPSGLPDHLRPAAERMYPRIVEAVGISVNAPDHRRALGEAVRKAMSDAVMQCYADHHTDPAFVKMRMQDARMKVLKGG